MDLTALILIKGVVLGITITALMPILLAPSATPCAWLPAEAAITPLDFSSSFNLLKRLYAPLSLNEKTGCKSSRFSQIDAYVDGADEVTKHLHMVKGGGGALTREKIVAAVSKKFVCIVDGSKVVDVMGKFPLPIEVIPMARSYVAREIVKMGGLPVYREGVVTDNGNQILDVHNLQIIDPPKLETALNQIVGVVTNGIFAHRGADVVLVGTPGGVETIS